METKPLTLYAARASPTSPGVASYRVTRMMPIAGLRKANCSPQSRADAGTRARLGRPAPQRRYFLVAWAPAPSEVSAAMKASGGTSTEPMFFIRFLPAFCFSSSLRLREMSPP